MSVLCCGNTRNVSTVVHGATLRARVRLVLNCASATQRRHPDTAAALVLCERPESAQSGSGPAGARDTVCLGISENQLRSLLQIPEAIRNVSIQENRRGVEVGALYWAVDRGTR